MPFSHIVIDRKSVTIMGVSFPDLATLETTAQAIGSNIEIKSIDLSKCRPYKDFGRGFYLTSIKEQAEIWAKRVSRIFSGESWITVFEFDESVLSADNLSIKVFDGFMESVRGL